MTTSPSTPPPPPPLPLPPPTEPPTHASILHAHRQIAPYIHRTPLLTSRSLNTILSSPQHPGAAAPQLALFFKCENQQRSGAFKARGAHCAVLRLIEREGHSALQRTGVVTHSSGNHAAALALAARTLQVPAYIVMPANSARNKIAATRAYGPREVVFSGPTAGERERVAEEVMARTGARMVPPYDWGDTVAGQGTVGVEMGEQYWEVVGRERERERVQDKGGKEEEEAEATESVSANGGKGFDAIVVPLGGGGLLSGVAIAMCGGPEHEQESQPKTPPPPPRQSEPKTKPKPKPTPLRSKKKLPLPLIFGAEPSHSGADDARRALAASPQPTRIPHVSSTTIADGLRTPVGLIPWRIVSSKRYIDGVFAVSEAQIRRAMVLVLERVKVWVEPSACVGVAVCAFCEEWRGYVQRSQEEEEQQQQQGEEGKGKGRKRKGWDVGVVLSGGNTTVEGVRRLFEMEMEEEEDEKEAEGKRKDGRIQTVRSRL